MELDMEKAYSKYELTTMSDGKIRGICKTNDNFDYAVPSEYAEWNVEYMDYEHMKRATGLTHYGFAGTQVLVVLDGIQI